ATGPARELGIGGMLDGIKGALNSNATLTWADAEFLKQQKVEAWSDMPVWAGDELGLSLANISRALAKGLTFRALGDTARDTVAWFKAQKPERQAKMRAGRTLEREAEVLAALHKASKCCRLAECERERRRRERNAERCVRACPAARRRHRTARAAFDRMVAALFL